MLQKVVSRGGCRQVRCGERSTPAGGFASARSPGSELSARPGHIIFPELPCAIEKPGPGRLSVSPRQGNRRGGGNQTGRERQFRTRAEREKQKYERHPSRTPHRVAEHHGASVLCPVGADEILAAGGAVLVHLEAPLEQGPDEARGADVPEGNTKE